MSMNVNNVSFGSKFGEQKAAKFGVKAIKEIKAPYSHSAEKITLTIEHMPAKEIKIPDKINKILLKISDNPLLRYYEKIFRG